MNAVTTYLIFDGNCKDAMEFYAKCMGGKLEVMPFTDAPMDLPPGAGERVMHARLSKGHTLLMASDTMPGTPHQQGNNFSISIDCETRAEIEQLFKDLGEGGTVTLPLQDMFWGAHFGMLKDKFGIHWMFNQELAKAA